MSWLWIKLYSSNDNVELNFGAYFYPITPKLVSEAGVTIQNLEYGIIFLINYFCAAIFTINGRPKICTPQISQNW